MPSKRGISILLVLCSTTLLAYSAFRAYHMSFTHDEGMSYAIVMGDPVWRGTANNHPLNTRMMTWANRWLGPQEWALRLPNVVAHILYLAFGLMLLRQLKNTALMILGFSLLNLNPYLMDFFSLARGYGLALGLSMGALYFLWRGWAQTELWRTAGLFLLSLTFASFADLANFAWVNLHLPLLAVTLLILWSRHGLLNVQLTRKGTTLLAAVKLNAVSFGVTAALAGANGWFLYNLSRRILALQENGQLYAGGVRGFIPDTLGTLINASYYTRDASEAAKQFITVFGITALLIIIVVVSYTTWKKRQISFSAVMLTVVTIAVLLPVMEHHLFGSLFPTYRTALGYIPLWSLLAVFFADENLSFSSRLVSIPAAAAGVLVIGVMTAHFLQTANLNRTYEWSYDVQTRTVMVDIGKLFSSVPKDRQINIGNFWVFMPAINYYRALFHYDWLTPAIREEPLVLDGHDIVYCFPQLLEGQQGRYTVLKAYPETGTMLVQVNSREP